MFDLAPIEIALIAMLFSSVLAGLYLAIRLQRRSAPEEPPLPPGM